MKYIYLLIAFFSWGSISSLQAQENADLIRRLKLADARMTGLEDSFDFKLATHRKKEALYEQVIQDSYNLYGVLCPVDQELELKSYLIRQIFIPIGQRVSRGEEQRLIEYADSIFNLYVYHPSDVKFKSLVQKYSADKIEHWVTSLEETKEFQTVLNAQKVGEISRPFTTPKGIHIVQKLKESDRNIEQVKFDFPNLEEFFDQLNLRIDKDVKSKLDRVNQKKKILIQSDYTTFYNSDFSRYALSNSARGFDLIWHDFLKYVLVKDLRARISQNENFAIKLKMSYEEVLLSAIYQKRVSDVAENDKDGLYRFFELHKTDYVWSKERFIGLLVFCKNRKVRKALHKELEKEPLNKWENIIALFNQKEELISYEMGSFEEGENATIDAFVFKKGKKSKLKRKGFPRVRVYGEILDGPKTLTDDIKPVVKADYLKFIEKEWEKDLISKYNAGKISPIFLKSVNNQTSN